MTVPVTYPNQILSGTLTYGESLECRDSVLCVCVCVWEARHCDSGRDPANTVQCPIVGSMLGQRRRRWTNIETALGQCLVFAGESSRPSL